MWAPLIEGAAQFFKPHNLCCKQQQYSQPTLRFLTKSGTSVNSAEAESLDGKEAFKVKFQVLFPSAASGELN